VGSAEDEPRRSRIRIPAIYLPREPASRGIAVPRAVRGAAFPARGVVGPTNGTGRNDVEKTMKLSQGEKLILLMLCEIQEHLKIEGGTNTKLIQEAIFSGNLWGLDLGLPRVFHDTETPPEVVGETGYILAMWDRLEQSFDNLAPSDKEWLAKHAEPFGRNVRFPGFDGNDEASYINAARFLIDSLERFQHFKGRDLNAHMPTLAAHRRMLSIFDPILQQVLHRDLNAAQIAEVVAA